MTAIKDPRNRLMQKSGGITIPKDVRRKFGFHEGGPVTIVSTEDGKGLVIRPMETYCAICNHSKTDTVFMGIPICETCIEGMANAHSTKNDLWVTSDLKEFKEKGHSGMLYAEEAGGALFAISKQTSRIVEQQTGIRMQVYKGEL